MKDKIILVLIYAAIHLAFNLWTEHSKMGQGVKHYLVNWRADGWVHGIMCSVSVCIIGIGAIMAIGLTLHALGI